MARLHTIHSGRLSQMRATSSPRRTPSRRASASASTLARRSSSSYVNGVKRPSTRLLSAGSGPYSATQLANSRGRVTPVDRASRLLTSGADTPTLAPAAPVPAPVMPLLWRWPPARRRLPAILAELGPVSTPGAGRAGTPRLTRSSSPARGCRAVTGSGSLLRRE